MAVSILHAVCFVVLAGVEASLHAAPVPSSFSAGPDATVDIDRFGVERVESLAPGVPLRFSLYGSPGARVLVAVDGAADALPLREIRPGMYEGEYVIGPSDRVDARSHVTATVEREELSRAYHSPSRCCSSAAACRGPRSWTRARPRRLGRAASARPGAARASPPPSSSPPTLPPPVAETPALSSITACADCATVQSIAPLPPMPHDVLAGLAGAVAGAAAANAASEGHARRVLRVVGAAAGYIVGGELARRLTRPAGYDVVLRLPDGSTLRRRYESAPLFRVGDTVSLSATSTATRPGSL